MLLESIFLIAITATGSVVTLGSALGYMLRFRIERPPIGTFSGSDILLLTIGLFTLPFLYMHLPALVLTLVVVAGLIALLFVGLRPALQGWRIWLCLVVLLGALCWTWWLSRQQWVTGGLLHWAINDVIIVLAAASAANLYTQGGMRLRHVAWFLAAYSLYDFAFFWIFPLTSLFSNEFTGALLQPAFGLVLGPHRATIGVGDLMAFTLFTLCAYKGFARRGAVLAILIVLLCGAVAPALLAVLLSHNGVLFFPAQVSFGPAGLVTAWWLLAHQQERSTGEWLFDLKNARHPTTLMQ